MVPSPIRLSASQLIRYVHNDLISAFDILIIPGTIFEVSSLIFCTYEAKSVPFHISSGFCYIHGLVSDGNSNCWATHNTEVLVILSLGLRGYFGFQRRSCQYYGQYMPGCFALQGILVFFSCDQAAIWLVQSVCPSITPFSPCSHHRIIMKFSGVITNNKSDDHAKGQGQRSMSQRSRPNFTVSGL